MLNWIENNIEQNMLSKKPDSIYISESIEDLMMNIETHEI